MKAIFITKDGSSQMREIDGITPYFTVPMKNYSPIDWDKDTQKLPFTHGPVGRRFRFVDRYYFHGIEFPIFAED